ncbi:FAD-dependent oxidoreductase, partial [Klebsiella variicola]|uniref:FAD-dependent oxidoreductase n=1 Tax=Klebsiella variicola TaxID=244366 RepID=UPI001D105C40
MAGARLLQQRGIDFLLFEARDRLGGRILSVSHCDEQFDDGFDLGPSWFWPDMQTGLAKLIRDLDLRIFPQYVDGDLLIERSRSEGPL